MEDVRPTVVRTPEGRGCEMDPLYLLYADFCL